MFRFYCMVKKKINLDLDFLSYSVDNVEKVFFLYVKYICIYLICMYIFVKNCNRNIIKKLKMDSIFNFKYIFK